QYRIGPVNFVMALPRLVSSFLSGLRSFTEKGEPAMNPELLELRTRMEALERLLADKAPSERRPGAKRYATPAVCAVLSLANVLLLVDGAAVRLRAAAPSSVTAPFTVVDDKGRALMTVEADAGGGRLAIYNADNRAVGILGATTDGSSAHLDVYERGYDEPKV